MPQCVLPSALHNASENLGLTERSRLPITSGDEVSGRNTLRNESGAITGNFVDGRLKRSSFIDSSCSDISLTYLEELLAQTTMDDVRTDTMKGANEKSPLSAVTCSDNEHERSLNPSASPTFAPPGIIVVTKMWSLFVTERLSFCNHCINTMKLQAMRTCLLDHGLNQVGEQFILRRRLQEFVRRVWKDRSTDNLRFNLTDQCNSTNSEETEPSLGSSVNNRTVSPVPTQSEASDKFKNFSEPVILLPDTFYSYLLIIDLEATCDSENREKINWEYPHEIIEFPILLYDTRTRQCVSVFHAYCKPKLHPNLSEFCKSLTHIDQAVVDRAHTFPQVLAEIEKWLFHEHGLSDVRCAIVCDCSTDMGQFVRIQCHLDNIPIPPWAKVWINLSKTFRAFYKVVSRKPTSLRAMLNYLGLEFVGQMHRGSDDAVNILRIVQTLLTDGCNLRVNERVDLGRPPKYVSSVPRLVSESTSGLMGSRLVLPLPTNQSSHSDKNDASDQTGQPSVLSADHRQSLLWLADVRKNRIPRD